MYVHKTIKCDVKNYKKCKNYLGNRICRLTALHPQVICTPLCHVTVCFFIIQIVSHIQREQSISIMDSTKVTIVVGWSGAQAALVQFLHSSEIVIYYKIFDSSKLCIHTEEEAPRA